MVRASTSRTIQGSRPTPSKISLVIRTSATLCQLLPPLQLPRWHHARGVVVQLWGGKYSPHPITEKLPLSCYKREEIDDADLKNPGLGFGEGYTVQGDAELSSRHPFPSPPSQPSHPGRLTTKLTHQAQQVQKPVHMLGNYFKGQKAKTGSFLVTSTKGSPALVIVLFRISVRICVKGRTLCGIRQSVCVCHPLLSSCQFRIYAESNFSPDHPCHRTSFCIHMISCFVFLKGNGFLGIL